MLSLKRNGAPFLRNGCAVLTEYALYAIFDGINEVLESGDDINFIRFGHFLTTDMEGHKCVLKGEEIMTKPYTKIIFRPSAKLKSSVNNKQVEDKENEE